MRARKKKMNDTGGKPSMRMRISNQYGCNPGSAILRFVQGQGLCRGFGLAITITLRAEALHPESMQKCNV